ncbi:MAG: D-glycero-beta-D-manno-heptose 1,7-bisphosphate 7-phosphatase [Xanthomonadales bacterium]|nr:D-glycero-beta-D-manno-heptose 1,7-bisphosphate 7-phosphatase [Xanthomonadales bacterium]
MNAGRKALFVDRDGVINVDRGYVYRIEDFEFLPGVPEALLSFQDNGFCIVVITNQSGIARGLYRESQLADLHDYMRRQLASAGIELAGIYYCPHHPEAAREQYREECRCRKPAPGMILDAVQELDIDLDHSILVGDSARDIEAGRAAGVDKCILLGTSENDPGHGQFEGLLQFATHYLEQHG